MSHFEYVCQMHKSKCIAKIWYVEFHVNHLWGSFQDATSQRNSTIQTTTKEQKTSNPYLYHPISPLQLANYFEGILRPEAGCNAAPQQTVITARVYCNVLYERDVGHETHLSFIGVFCDSSKSLISTTPPFRFWS